MICPFVKKMLAKLFCSKLGQGSRSNIEKWVKLNFGPKYVVFGIKIQGFDYLLHIKGFQMHLNNFYVNKTQTNF